jgi:hypothetical protein
LCLGPAPATTHPDSFSPKVATIPRSRGTTIATPSRQEDSSARMRELSWPRATAYQEQRSHPRGHAGSSRALSWQESSQGSLRGRSTPVTTTPSGKEVSPSAPSPRTTTTPMQVGAWGLATPGATTPPRAEARGSTRPELRRPAHQWLPVHRSVMLSLILVALPTHVHMHM